MKLLVAGIGNIFLGDDGFGPEVARVLSADPIEAVTIEDYGIRSLHLAFELVSGYDRAFLIDAVPRGGAPGTLYVLEPATGESSCAPDAHRMDLENVLALVRTIGGELPALTIVGCEPLAVEENMGLSDPVRDAVRPAADLVRRLVTNALAARAADQTRSEEWIEA